MGQSTTPPHTSLNALTTDAAREVLTRCCGAQRWVDGMLDRRPFESTAAMFTAAREIWVGLERVDYVEAFAHHPRIGADLRDMAKRFARTASLSAREQAKVARADPATLRTLRDENERYFQRFGYIFIVRATGKSAEEVLSELRARLTNAPEAELNIAAQEQAKITELRLAQLA